MTAYLVGSCCCKCCLKLKFRLIGRHGIGYGPFAPIERAEMELYSLGGELLYHSTTNYTNSYSGYMAFGPLILSNDNARSLFSLNWLNEGDTETTISLDADHIEWNDSITRLCDYDGHYYFLRPEDRDGISFTDTCPLTPSPYDQQVETLAYTDWHEIVLCKDTEG